MNIQLTTIGAFKEAKDLIDALNKLDNKKVSCRILRRFHRAYKKISDSYFDSEGLGIACEIRINIWKKIFLNLSVLGKVPKCAERANIPYLYFAAVSRMHDLYVRQK